jgi:hypothetical protein
MSVAPGRTVGWIALPILLVVVVGASFARAGPPDALPAPVVRARAFELVDEQGRVRAALRVEAGPRLMLYDERGRHRLALALQEDAVPGLELFTPDGGHAVEVRDLDDEAMLALHDRAGPTRLLMKVAGTPARATASFLAADGSVETTWPASQAGTPPPTGK